MSLGIKVRITAGLRGYNCQKCHAAAAELLWEEDWGAHKGLKKVGSLAQCHGIQRLC